MTDVGQSNASRNSLSTAAFANPLKHTTQHDTGFAPQTLPSQPRRVPFDTCLLCSSLSMFKRVQKQVANVQSMCTMQISRLFTESFNPFEEGSCQFAIVALCTMCTKNCWQHRGQINMAGGNLRTCFGMVLVGFKMGTTSKPSSETLHSKTPTTAKLPPDQTCRHKDSTKGYHIPHVKLVPLASTPVNLWARQLRS